ncbi:hypothetical protein [Ammoniphilus sp. 3BR4]|uniref:hypothetical protein n=1 Tax=Ammoniphilus sp. 3BR4 TaxID=3158265 RepID=UPI003465CF85
MNPKIRNIIRLLQKNNQLLWDINHRQRQQIRQLRKELKTIKGLLAPNEIHQFKSRIVRFK